MSLDAADTQREREAIVAHWERRFPIALAVTPGYGYLALAKHHGTVVAGSEPEFEQVCIFADSVDTALLQLASMPQEAWLDAAGCSRSGAPER